MEVCPAVMGDYTLPRPHRRAETDWLVHIYMLKTQDFYCERQKGGQKRSRWDGGSTGRPADPRRGGACERAPCVECPSSLLVPRKLRGAPPIRQPPHLQSLSGK